MLQSAVVLIIGLQLTRIDENRERETKVILLVVQNVGRIIPTSDNIMGSNRKNVM